MSKRTRHAGFTLVELLVVILIIGILVSLLLPAVWGVLRISAQFRRSADMSQLEQAIEDYKRNHGDYPTDFSDVIANSPANYDQTVTYRHVRKIFQRIDPTTSAALGDADILMNHIKTHGLTPAEALVFWLGGMSNDHRRPFTGKGGPLVVVGGTPLNPQCALRIQERHKPTFAFDESRLFMRTDPNNPNVVVAASFIAYGTEAPYVYFDSRTYHFVYADNNNNLKPGYAACPTPVPDDPASTTIALPYKSDILNTSFPNSAQTDSILLDNAVYFANRDTFQLICAGGDGLFGPIVGATAPVLMYQDANGNPVPLFTRFPSGKGFHPTVWVQNVNTNVNPPLEGYFKGQEDNLTNFSEGKTIQGAAQQ